jgi:hypothetical protein
MTLVANCTRLAAALRAIGSQAQAALPTEYARVIELCHEIASAPLPPLAGDDLARPELVQWVNGEPLPPPIDRHPDLAQLCETRLELWQLVASCHTDFLCQYHYDDGDDGTGGRFCFGELLFGALCRADVEIVLSGHVDMTVSAEQIEYCVDRALIVETARGLPFVRYSPAQIVDALDVLRNAFYQCHYDDGLQRYVELLEMAAAWTLYCERPFDATQQYDTDRVLVSDTLLSDHVVGTRYDDPVYERANATFCSAVWPTLLGAHRLIIGARDIGDANVDVHQTDMAAAELVPDADAVRARVRSLLAVCASNHYIDASVSLREHHMVAHMRPGDREVHKLAHPSTSKSDGGIVSDSLGDARMKLINAELQLSPMDGVRRHLEALQAADAGPTGMRLRGREPIWFGACLHDLLDMVTQGAPGNEWAEHYSRRASDVRADPREMLFASQQRPLVVQLFNHWQLVYDRRVYWFDSALLSYVAWWQLRQTHARIEPFAHCALFSCPIASCFVLRNQLERARLTPEEQARADAQLREWTRRMLEADEPNPSEAID